MTRLDFYVLWCYLRKRCSNPSLFFQYQMTKNVINRFVLSREVCIFIADFFACFHHTLWMKFYIFFIWWDYILFQTINEKSAINFLSIQYTIKFGNKIILSFFQKILQPKYRDYYHKHMLSCLIRSRYHALEQSIIWYNTRKKSFSPTIFISHHINTSSK